MKSLTTTLNESLNEDFVCGLYDFDGIHWKIEWNIIQAITDSAFFKTLSKNFKSNNIAIKSHFDPYWPNHDKSYIIVVNDDKKNRRFYDVFYVDGKSRCSICGDITDRLVDLRMYDNPNHDLIGYKITKEEAHEFYKMYWNLWEKEISNLTKTKINAVKNYF